MPLHTKFRSAQKIIKSFQAEAAWVFAGQALALVGTLVGVRVLTDFLPPGAYGTLGLAMTLSALFTEVVIGGLVHGFTRFYSVAAKAKRIDAYLTSVRRLTLLAVLIALVVVVAATPIVITLTDVFDVYTCVAIGIFASLFGTSAALNAVLNGARNRKIVATSSILDTWFRVVLALLAMSWFGATATVVLLAYCLGLVVVVARQIFHVRLLLHSEENNRKKIDASNREWSREILIFALPISFWGIFTWAQQAADRWALEAFRSTVEVGFYGVLLQLGFFPMTVLMGVLGTFLAPIIFEKTDDQSRSIKREHDLVWRKLLYILLGFSSLAALVAYLGTDWLLILLVSESYRHVGPLLPLMVLAGGFYGTAGLLSMRLMSHMRTVQLARIMISSSVIGVVLIAFMTLYYGILGTVLAKLLFGAIYLIMMYFATIRYGAR